MIPPHSHRLKRSLFPEGEGTTKNDIPLFHIPLSQWVHRYAQLRAITRIGALTVWVPLSVGFEACLLPIPGIAKICWTRVVWGVLCRIIGLRIRVIGERVGTIGGYRARQRGERPVIYVSNHTSWLDVPVLGTLLPSVFVAKGDIQHPFQHHRLSAWFALRQSHCPSPETRAVGRCHTHSDWCEDSRFPPVRIDFCKKLVPDRRQKEKNDYLCNRKSVNVKY